MSKREAPGTVRSIRGSFIPWGWFAEDASVLIRADYPALYAAIGTTYNIGGESGLEFRLPDSRGRVDIGAGTGTGLTARVLGTPVGTETHLLSGAESGTASHSHGVSDPGHAHGGSFEAYDGSGQGDGNDGDDHETNPASVAASGTGISINASASVAAAAAHNNMQPSLPATKMIKW